MATVEVAEQEKEAGDIFATLRPFTKSPVFVGVQVGFFFLFSSERCFLCQFVRVYGLAWYVDCLLFCVFFFVCWYQRLHSVGDPQPSRFFSRTMVWLCPV